MEELVPSQNASQEREKKKSVCACVCACERERERTDFLLSDFAYRGVIGCVSQSGET